MVVRDCVGVTRVGWLGEEQRRAPGACVLPGFAFRFEEAYRKSIGVMKLQRPGEGQPSERSANDSNLDRGCAGLGAGLRQLG